MLGAREGYKERKAFGRPKLLADREAAVRTGIREAARLALRATRQVGADSCQHAGCLNDPRRDLGLNGSALLLVNQCH
jgi:hypothetical protein